LPAIDPLSKPPDRIRLDVFTPPRLGSGNAYTEQKCAAGRINVASAASALAAGGFLAAVGSCPLERKKVEVRFAHMKLIHKLDRLRLRGLSGAKDEVLLTALAQNLKRLAKFVWQPAEPRPIPA